MPLMKGSSHKTIAKNAGEMMASGHPRDQAWAAAYSKAKESKRKGGKRPKKKRDE